MLMQIGVLAHSGLFRPFRNFLGPTVQISGAMELLHEISSQNMLTNWFWSQLFDQFWIF